MPPIDHTGLRIFLGIIQSLALPVFGALALVTIADGAKRDANVLFPVCWLASSGISLFLGAWIGRVFLDLVEAQQRMVSLLQQQLAELQRVNARADAAAARVATARAG